MRARIVGVALGVTGFVGTVVGCVDTDPSKTPTAIEAPLQRRGPTGAGEELAPPVPDVEGETIQRAAPEPERR